MKLIPNAFEYDEKEEIINELIRAGADSQKARNYYMDFAEKRQQIARKYNGDCSSSATKQAFVNFIKFVQHNVVETINSNP